MKDEFDKSAEQREALRQKLIASLTPDQRKDYEKLQKELQRERQNLIKSQKASRRNEIIDKIRETRDLRKNSYIPRGAKRQTPDLWKEVERTIDHNHLVERNRYEAHFIDRDMQFLEDCQKNRPAVKEDKGEYMVEKSKNERLTELYNEISRRMDDRDENTRDHDDRDR